MLSRAGTWLRAAAGLVLALSAPLVLAQSAPDGASLYREHCAACHGALRLGGMGPALLPESLSRLRKPEMLQVMNQGRPATQMPGFSATLDKAQIAALAQWLSLIHISEPTRPY